jgi:hypothetical protein
MAVRPARSAPASLPRARPRAATGRDDRTVPNRAWTHPVSEPTLDSGVTLPAMSAGRDDRILTCATVRRQWSYTLACWLPSAAFGPTQRTSATPRPRITGDRVCTLDPTSATARVRPSPMIKPIPASIRARVGNKLGTVLATSAPCGHNAKTPRWRSASLGFADFKHHRNVFSVPRIWQARRTQNPVPARGCGFKSHLRY